MDIHVQTNRLNICSTAQNRNVPYLTDIVFDTEMHILYTHGSFSNLIGIFVFHPFCKTFAIKQKNQNRVNSS